MNPANRSTLAAAMPVVLGPLGVGLANMDFAVVVAVMKLAVAL